MARTDCSEIPVPRPHPAVLVFGLLLCSGCGLFEGSRRDSAPCEADTASGSKTLLSWNSRSTESPEKSEGPNGEGAAEVEDAIATDRPDFTEASSTVGKGRIQLESGYTFSRDRSGGIRTTTHSYPEALLRIGALADWLEFRIGQNFGETRSGLFSASGAEDLYLGVKLGLTEQKQVLPEMALILQTTVPTGHSEFTGGKMQPGFNWLYGWDVVPDRLTFGGSTQANRVYDEINHGYIELAQSLTIGYGLTDRLSAYTEWFAFFPAGAVALGVTAQHYLDGGFTYQFTPNFQVDIRAGIGVSRRADDYFIGSGFGVRY